jgi:4-amino-4-deoxy-L-arabinose transferase-like glycosyltransferase
MAPDDPSAPVVSQRPRFSSRAAPVGRPLPLWILYPIVFVAVYLAHWPLLHLGYFWDEAGYYIPAALDLLRTGSLIPHSTLTNAHPPLPSLLLAGWWRISGFTPLSTRTLICLVSAAALLGVFRLARSLAGNTVAATVTLLTALYPIWFVQSTLAHADIFAAAFTLWALSYYFQQNQSARDSGPQPPYLPVAVLFSLAALAKETAIVTPAVLALWELAGLLAAPRPHAAPASAQPRTQPIWIAILLVPVLPLALWYAYHLHETGFLFGNPEFLRYNATSNFTPARILLSLWHRAVHLTLHMNLYVPVVSTIAVLAIPRRPEALSRALSKPVFPALCVIVLGNALAFSVLGGALLTRYLLPLYPLVLLVCVAVWKQRLVQWGGLAALTAIAFFAALRVNPPYAFAPEDNLTYRDMIVLHQQAIHLIAQRFPQATVLTAWPATTELEHPDLGYTRIPLKVDPIDNFSLAEIQKAAADPGGYDTALVFSTKWVPPPGRLDLSRLHEQTDAKLFDFHRDLPPAAIATLLHGDIVWQSSRNGEWAAVLRFPRAVEARTVPNPGNRAAARPAL